MWPVTTPTCHGGIIDIVEIRRRCLEQLQLLGELGTDEASELGVVPAGRGLARRDEPSLGRGAAKVIPHIVAQLRGS